MSEPRVRSELRQHPVEMAAGLVSLALILALAGFLVWSGLADQGRPPAFELAVARVYDVGGSTYVEVSARNIGDRTAVQALMRGTAPDGVTAEASFDFLPAQSSRTATLVFAKPVGGNEVKLQIIGFADP